MKMNTTDEGLRAEGAPGSWYILVPGQIQRDAVSFEAGSFANAAGNQFHEGLKCTLSHFGLKLNIQLVLKVDDILSKRQL